MKQIGPRLVLVSLFFGAIQLNGATPDGQIGVAYTAFVGAFTILWVGKDSNKDDS